MTETTDQLGWTLPTPGDETEAGEWASILNAALNDDIEPDVAEALSTGNRVHDITDYGAVGDGTTDDSGAIQAATDAASQSSGMGVVYYPETGASWHLNSGINLRSGTYHQGPRPYGAHITASGLGREEALFGNREGPHDLGFWGLFIDCTGAWGSQSYHFNQKGIAATPSPGTENTGDIRNFSVEYCHTLNSGGSGIGVDSIINQRFAHNIVENAGTVGQDQGGNGIGIGVGQVDGLCPTWVVDNYVIGTSQFSIIMEQTGGRLPTSGIHIRDNTIIGGARGIGVELVHGFDISGNTIVTSDRMEHGIIVDHLDDTRDPSYGSVMGNSVIGDVAASVEAGLIGAGAHHVSASDNTVEPSAGDGFVLDPGATRCSLNGLGQEGAGAGNSPNGGWDVGQQVENTDDGTVWVQTSSGFVQVG